MFIIVYYIFGVVAPYEYPWCLNPTSFFSVLSTNENNAMTQQLKYTVFSFFTPLFLKYCFCKNVLFHTST